MEVIASVLIENASGLTGYRCHMSDGSVWQCDPYGQDWKKIGEPTQFLTDQFNAMFPELLDITRRVDKSA